MATLHIEHAITDYAVWKEAFDRFADMRKQSGVQHHRVHQPIDDAAYIVVNLDFGTAEQAASFLEFLRDKVWSSAQNAPGLAGTPQTRILETRDEA